MIGDRHIIRKSTSSIFIALLLTNMLFILVNIAPVSASPGLSAKWARSLGSDAQTNIGPLAADINGDGKLEIIVTGGTSDDPRYMGTDGTVTALDGTTGNVVWQVKPGGVTRHTLSEIADINKDGLLEIVVSGSYPVVLRGTDGSTIWRNTAVSSYSLISPVQDIDGDGYSEIFASSGLGPYVGDDYFTVLSYDGKVLRQTGGSWHPCWGGMTIGDANFDGIFELYQGDRNYGYSTSDPYTYGEWGVRCLDPYTLTPLWNDSSILCSSHTPMLADVDKDSVLDVIVTHQSTGSGGLAVLNFDDGSVVTTGGKNRKSQSLGLASHSQPTVGDIDGDGNLEIITCRTTNPKIWDLYDWKLDATLPVVCYEPPKVGDVTGDGKLDIIAMANDGIYIYSYDSASNAYVQVDHVDIVGNAFTLLQDVDGDSKNELITTSGGGTVRCFDTDANAPTPRVNSQVPFYSDRHLGVAEYVPPAGPVAPVISQPSPSDKAINVPVALSQLSFNLTDYQQDLVDYTVTTSPDIGSGSGTDKINGRYSISVSNLRYSTTYFWTVTATDGLNPRTKTLTFTTESMPPWWSTDWSYRRTISIDHTKVGGNQTNFPVTIDVTDSEFSSKAQLDGDDFVFTDANQVKLVHEIEQYDTGTGHLVAWVKIPFLSASVDTSILMYYGNPTCGNQQDPIEVWDTNNMLVLHLDEPHECRMWGTIADSLPYDVVVSDLITDTYSLKKLGASNDDGWGLVWYNNTVPEIKRGPTQANLDPKFDSAAYEMANSGAWIGIGHVRAASQGGIPSWGDPHPFMRYKNGKWWAFAHNGNVDKTKLKALIGSAYLAANPPTYGTNWDDSLVVDSDLYSLWVLKCIEANHWNVTLGIAQAIKELTEAGADSGTNFLLTEGETLWGYRRGNTLWYYYQATSPQYSTIASQPPEGTSPPGWVQLSDYNFITITKNTAPSVITDIRQYYPTPILVDSELSSSTDSADLRTNNAGQDWYESRAQTPSLLTLDTADIGGNSGKKAKLSGTSTSTDNAYLTQELATAQTGVFSAQWDIYVDSIVDLSGTTPDRSGIMMLGSNSTSYSPNQNDVVRFVFLAFLKNGGGTSGSVDLVAMTAFSTYTTVASGLSLDQWYTIRVIVNVPAKTYQVFVDGVSKGSFAAVTSWAQTAVTHISFAQWNDGAGTFYVDNVYAPARNRYKLAISSAGNGSVSMSPGESSYLPATVVTLAANPDPNWYFSSWSGDLTGDENPEVIIVDTSKAVTATFISQGYTLSVNVVGSGTVTVNPDQASYPDGSVVTLTATPALGWSFSGWSGDLSGNTNPATITIDGNKAITATFAQDQYTLTINTVGSGSVTKNPSKMTYTYGETVTLTASGASGWLFSSWSDDLTGSTNPSTITMTADKTVTATFIQGYSLTVNIIGGGSVSKDPDQAGFIAGTVVTLTATPAVGWSFDSWSGDLAGNTNPATITMSSNKVVTATFTQNQYTVTINIVGGGSVTKNPNKATYTYGETVTLTATADPGWEFSEFSCGCDNPFTMTVDGDKVVTATFVRVYALTIGIIGSGSVAKDPDRPSYLPDSLVTLTATPAVGWSFSGWSINLTGNENPATITMDSDKVVVATFTQDQYTLTINIVGSGSVTKTPDKTAYTYGETVTLKASPISGWSFFRWSGDLSGSTNPTTITINGDKAVTVTFIQGTICFDSTVNANNGALYGGVTRGIAGKMDGAYRFDGTTGYINIPHSNTLSGFTQGLTISFWVNFEDTARRQMLLGKYNSGAGQRSWYVEYQNTASYGKVLGFFASQDGTAYKEYYARFVPTAGTWYYITVVWQTNAVPKFYVNGAQVTTIGTSTITSIYNNVGIPLLIGRCAYDSTRYFKGSLDEIRISNIARSASWILTSYNSQNDASAFCRVGTEESLPPTPFVLDPNPSNEATNIPITTTELDFTLQDYQNDLMNYEVSTSPDIGGGTATGVPDGRYSTPVSGLQYSTTYTWYVHVTDGTHETDVTYTFTTAPLWLVDSELSDSVDSADLRLDGTGQDWYESRAQAPTLLFLDTNNIGGDTSKKAGFTASSTTNAYLTQEFSTAQTTTFTVQWDIYVDSILDISSPDRAGFMLIGRSGTSGPNRGDSDRFVYLAFYKNGGGTSGTMDLVAMSSFNSYTTVASGLNMKQWYTIKVAVNVVAGTYDVYVDGVFKATKNRGAALTSLTHISFAQWNDGAGAFYVDNVLSPAQDRYGLSLITAGSGSIANSPMEATYASGTIVTLTATPAPEWYFDSWSGGVSGNTNPITIKMDSDKIVTAIFTQDYSLTVNTVGSGSVSRNPDQSTYTPGTVVNLTATPAADWSFSGWSGDLTGNANPATITMNSSKVVTATFTQTQYALTVNVVGNGAVYKNPDLSTYAPGTVVTLTAAPTIGWSFSAWTGDLTGNANPVIINMTSDKTVTATFTQDQYTLTVSVDGGGSVTRTPEQPTYTYGTSVQLKATPEPGYVFSQWTGDLSSTLNPDSITMTGNKSVTAVFVWTQTNWWNGSWQYRRTITIDHNKVSGDQTDFPVLIDLTDVGLTLKAQTDGDDFVFTNANQAKLSHEIELYESSTGHLVAWVKISLLSSTTDTVLYMYYGNSTCASQQDTTAVWDSSNKLVLHLDEKTGTHYDSTVNGNNGTPYNGVIQGTSGKIDGADTFDGSNDYVQVAHSSTLSGFTQSMTVSFWLRLQDTARRQMLLGKYNSGAGQRSWYVEYQNTASYGKVLGFFASQDGTAYKEYYARFVPTAGTWYYITVVWQTNAVPKFYVNGAQVTTIGTVTIASLYNNAGVPLYIGRCSYDATRYLNGSLDEIRISNPARSAGWILTCYNGQNNPSAFYQVGAEEQYAAPRYTLTINIVGQGSVTKDPNQITYPKDTVVKLTATAVPGWTFTSWSGDLTGSTNPTSITMDSNKAVTATFTQDVYTLTVSTAGSGSFSLNNTGPYHYGDIVQLTAVPAIGWSFGYWSGDASGSANPTTVNMTGNKAVMATFTEDEYTLTTATVGQGSISRNNSGPYHYGDVVQLTAAPEANWYFAGWSGDLSGFANPTTITMDNNKAVNATFIKVGYTLTINVVGNGSVTISPEQSTYDPGTLVNLTATPAIGWSFSGWSGDLIANDNPVTLTMDGNKTITATFTQDQHTLDVTVVGNGQVTKSPDLATYAYGTIVTLNATANTGWTWSGWSGNLSGSTNPTTITMDGNKSVTATFTANQYALTVTTVGSGSVSQSPDPPYYYGNVVTLTAVPQAGWLFSQWSGDITGSTNPATITITGNKAVTATFIRLLVDSEFSDSADSAALIANGAGQDWYESRNDLPTLLFLDTNNVGGDASKKAGFTASESRNAYLSQEFGSAQTGVFTVQWDIYVDSVLPGTGSVYRAGIMLIGRDGGSGPNRNAADRFVYMAFSKPGGGTSGTMSLIAISPSTTIATGLNLKQWYTIKVVVNVTARTYAVYVDGVFKATVTGYQALTSLTCISFAQWNDGAGAFYVDNVFAPAVDRYKLSVNIVGNGSVTVSPGEATYASNTVVNLTATPSTGWYFSGWSDDLSSTDNPAFLTMNSNKNVTAHFSQPEYSLNVTINPQSSGSVSLNNTGPYHYGDKVELTAVPTPGWTFSSWTGDLIGISSPAVITIDDNKSIEAHFAQLEYSLTVTVSPEGSGSVSLNNTGPYHYGDKVELNATANVGWNFFGWSGGLSGNTNPDVITMDGNKSVTATFTQGQFSLTVTASPLEGGSVNVNDTGPYTYGDWVELTAVPANGWSFANWDGDLSGTTSPAVILIDGNKFVTAYFAQIEYSLTIAVSPGGSGSVNANQTSPYHYGDKVELTAVPAVGWSFSSWSGGLTGSDNPATLTITGNTTITATFTQDQYTLTVNIVGSGTVDRAPSESTYTYGTNVTLTANAASGWLFDKWTADLTGSQNPATINMTSSKTVNATFIRLLVDSEFNDSIDNATLRANGTGQDWYESRTQAPTLLYLDETNAGSNAGKKAGFTASNTTNAYLTQEFRTPQTSVFSVQWDIYVHSILDISSPDRAGWMLIGDDLTPTTPGPNSDNAERFVYMAFFRNGGGTSGTMNLVVVNRTGSFTNHWVIASGLNLKQWYTIKVVVNVPGGTYDVYVDGILQKAGISSRNAKTSVTHISFAQWNDGAGAFYVDNVFCPSVDTYKLAVNINGAGIVTINPGESSYLFGTVVTLTPIPDSGYIFDHWEVNGVPVGSDEPYLLTMDSNKAVIAFFRLE